MCADLNGPGAEATAAEIKQAGSDAVAAQANIASEADCEKMVQTAVDTYGRLDVLYTHAGILHPKDGPITELSAEAIDESFNTNCKGMLPTG